ncbi:hypothetical protein BC629DRAFT_1490135 [Irpex lacteus]|nr:hypothetical protein BC629DRAFT_1490135 [Irpex lacteus]
MFCDPLPPQCPDIYEMACVRAGQCSKVAKASYLILYTFMTTLNLAFSGAIVASNPHV